MYRGYVGRVRERVRGHVAYPRGARERGISGQVDVEFRIDRAGRIECVALRRSSGSEILDRHVLSALRLAQPFAALPSHVSAPPLAVSGTFNFRIAEGPISEERTGGRPR